MTTLSPDALLDQLRWRYATKRFDATRAIPDATWAALEETLVLSPSSFGLQPWRFVVVRDPRLRQTLRACSWDQAQVTEASQYVVFAAKSSISEADIDGWIRRLAEVRGTPVAALEGYRGMMVGHLVKGMSGEQVKDWCARQTYIALGNLMTAAAVLGIDTCPMEGIEPAKYDEALGLTGEGCFAVCGCALGYRAADDKYAGTKKARYPMSDVMEWK